MTWPPHLQFTFYTADTGVSYLKLKHVPAANKMPQTGNKEQDMGIAQWQKLGKQGRHDSASIQLLYTSFCIVHILWIKMPVTTDMAHR